MWLWIWLGFVVFLPLVPFVYGWGCRRWGEPATAAEDGERLRLDPRDGPPHPEEDAALRLEASVGAPERSAGLPGLPGHPASAGSAGPPGSGESESAWRWLPEVLWLTSLVLLAWVVLAVTVA